MAEKEKERQGKGKRGSYHWRENSEGAKAWLVEKLCDNLKPQFLLSDDGNLQAKNTWRKAM